jgi:hypothetical protein
VAIFPKLPVYLREYHGTYLKNGRVKDVVKAMKSDVELLDALNKELVCKGSTVSGTKPKGVTSSYCNRIEREVFKYGSDYVGRINVDSDRRRDLESGRRLPDVDADCNKNDVGHGCQRPVPRRFVDRSPKGSWQLLRLLRHCFT